MECQDEYGGGEPPLKKPKLNPLLHKTETSDTKIDCDTCLTSSAESNVQLDPPPHCSLADDALVDGPVAVRDGDCPVECVGRESASQGLLQHTREEDVGICQYISDLPGIFGVLKQRYSDFVVRELAVDGSIVQLTDYSLPVDPLPTTSVSLEDVFSSKDISRIQSLSEKEGESASLEISLNSSVTKEQRKIMHEAIREHFPMLESETGNADGETGHRVVIICHGNKPKKDKRSRWPQHRGDFCQFVLHKENKDTMEAINLLAKVLRVKSSIFHYAGTKDRRAVTSQLVTGYRLTAEKLIKLNDFNKNIQVGNFKYVKEQLHLGSLSGNKFSIILRRISCDDHVIEGLLASLKEVGFVNYFGMQRFGTGCVPTHHVGRCLLHSDWEGAIDLILKPRSGESQEVSDAREYYHKHKDATGALKRLPKWMNMERLLLQGLEKHANKRNFLGALNFIPRNMRLMYAHSWQSYVWNKLVSWRLQAYGSCPVVGDIVRKSHSGVNNSSRSEIEFLSEETKSKCSIHDILLPLPGYDVELPNNPTKDEYNRLLSLEELTVDQLQHRVKDFSLSGAYRPIVIKPTDISWEVFHYDDVTEPLILTDVDLMNNKSPPISIPGSKFKALKLEFILPSSTYATMALRDILKMDTSSAHQSTLNDTHTE